MKPVIDLYRLAEICREVVQCSFWYCAGVATMSAIAAHETRKMLQELAQILTYSKR